MSGPYWVQPKDGESYRASLKEITELGVEPAVMMIKALYDGAEWTNGKVTITDIGYPEKEKGPSRVDDYIKHNKKLRRWGDPSIPEEPRY